MLKSRKNKILFESEELELLSKCAPLRYSPFGFVTYKLFNLIWNSCRNHMMDQEKLFLCMPGIESGI